MAKREKWCYVCNGSGSIPCSRCGGTGQVRGNVNRNRFYTCSECNGRGAHQCWKCFGRGWFETDEDD